VTLRQADLGTDCVCARTPKAPRGAGCRANNISQRYTRHFPARMGNLWHELAVGTCFQDVTALPGCAGEVVVIHLAMRGSIRTISSAAKIRSRVACTESARVEFLRYEPQQVLDDIVTHDVTQRIRVPLATAKDSLLAPSPVTGSLCPHLSGVAALIVHRPGTNPPALLPVPA